VVSCGVQACQETLRTALAIGLLYGLASVVLGILAAPLFLAKA
jgi:hypothetical protein